MKWDFFEIAGRLFLAVIVFSWIYVAINGCKSCAPSWSEYYETSGR